MISINKEYKLADVIHIDYRILSVLERFEIKLGFGNKNIEDIAHEYGINQEAFLLVI